MAEREVVGVTLGDETDKDARTWYLQWLSGGFSMLYDKTSGVKLFQKIEQQNSHSLNVETGANGTALKRTNEDVMANGASISTHENKPQNDEKKSLVYGRSPDVTPFMDALECQSDESIECLRWSEKIKSWLTNIRKDGIRAHPDGYIHALTRCATEIQKVCKWLLTLEPMKSSSCISSPTSKKILGLDEPCSAPARPTGTGSKPVVQKQLSVQERVIRGLKRLSSKDSAEEITSQNLLPEQKNLHELQKLTSWRLGSSSSKKEVSKHPSNKEDTDSTVVFLRMYAENGWKLLTLNKARKIRAQRSHDRLNAIKLVQKVLSHGLCSTAKEFTRVIAHPLLLSSVGYDGAILMSDIARCLRSHIRPRGENRILEKGHAKSVEHRTYLVAMQNTIVASTTWEVDYDFEHRRPQNLWGPRAQAFPCARNEASWLYTFKAGDKVCTHGPPVHLEDGTSFMELVGGGWIATDSWKQVDYNKEDCILNILEKNSTDTFTHFRRDLQGGGVSRKLLIGHTSKFIENIAISLLRSVKFCKDHGLRSVLQRATISAFSMDYSVQNEFIAIAKSGFVEIIARACAEQRAILANTLENLPKEAKCAIGAIQIETPPPANSNDYEPIVSMVPINVTSDAIMKLHTHPYSTVPVAKTVWPPTIPVSNLRGTWAQLAKGHGHSGKWFRYDSNARFVPSGRLWEVRVVIPPAIGESTRKDILNEMVQHVEGVEKTTKTSKFPWPPVDNSVPILYRLNDSMPFQEACALLRLMEDGVCMSDMVPVLDTKASAGAGFSKPPYEDDQTIKFKLDKLHTIRYSHIDGMMTSALYFILKRSSRNAGSHITDKLCQQALNPIIGVFTQTVETAIKGINQSQTTTDKRIDIGRSVCLCPDVVASYMCPNGGLVCKDWSTVPNPSFSIGFWLWLDEPVTKSSLVVLTNEDPYTDDDTNDKDKDDHFLQLVIDAASQQVELHNVNGKQSFSRKAVPSRRWVHILVSFQYSPAMDFASLYNVSLRLDGDDNLNVAHGKLATQFSPLKINPKSLTRRTSVHYRHQFRVFPLRSETAVLLYNMVISPFLQPEVSAPPSTNPNLPKQSLAWAKDFSTKGVQTNMASLTNAWNPDDKDTKHMLTEDNLKLASVDADGTNHLIRALDGFKSGIHYWEIQVITRNTGGSGYHWLGIATLDAARESPPERPGSQARNKFMFINCTHDFI